MLKIMLNTYAVCQFQSFPVSQFPSFRGSQFQSFPVSECTAQFHNFAVEGIGRED